MLLGTLLMACSKDIDDIEDDGSVKFKVASVEPWRAGSLSGNAAAKEITRATDVTKAPDVKKVYVKATPQEGDVKYLVLTKVPSSTADKDGYFPYTIDPQVITAENIGLFTFDARTIVADSYADDKSYSNIWGEEKSDATQLPLFGDVDYLSGIGEKDGVNLRFSLAHNTALVRFFLGVGSGVNSIRTIKLKSLKIFKSTGVDEETGKPTFDTEGTSYVVNPVEPAVPEELTVAGRNFMEFHINPAAAELKDGETSEILQYLKTVLIVAKYDVYDKSGQLTRKDCIAKNTLKLNIGENITKGYYYDVVATINPDFLYVLSDGDKVADVELK